MKRELEVVSEERPEGVTSHSIGAPLDGERLDRVVSMLWDCSRSEASTLIAAGEVRLDDEVVTTKSRRVVAGDAIELRVAAPPLGSNGFTLSTARS